MALQRLLSALALAIAVAIVFSGPGYAQVSDIALEPQLERPLDELFFDMLPAVAIGGLLLGLATGSSLRTLRHIPGVHFPSRVRRFAFIIGAGLTAACEAIYLGAGGWRQISLLAVLTHGESSLIPVLFAVLWYAFAYAALRVPRWSGHYALRPLLKGHRS